MAWEEPKTDWVETDRFNIQDFNRIKNNLAWLYQFSLNFFNMYSIEPMGENISSYESYWDVEIFNKFERNLEKIGEKTKIDVGQSTTFYYNGLFISWEELNRIEGASLRIYERLKELEKLRKRLPFRLGKFKEVFR